MAKAPKRPASRKRRKPAAPSASRPEAAGEINGAPEEHPNPNLGPGRYTREDLRMDLVRSVVTEPLLTHITEAPQNSFDVIVALNELFPEGVDSALVASV